MGIKQEINYFIDRDKKVCVAKIVDLPSEIEHFMGKFFSCSREAPSSVLKWYSKAYKRMPNTLQAKATCSMSDDYDVDVGMKIARMRLEQKLMKWELKVLSEYAADMEAELNAACNVIDSLEMSYLKMDSKILAVTESDED